MEIILILIMLIPLVFNGLIVYVMEVYSNTNNESDEVTKDIVDNNTNDESDEITVNIGDVFVYEPEPLCIISEDPFEDVSTVHDVDSSRTYIVDDLKTNYEGVVWVKYHSLTSHRRKKCFYHTSSIDAFLYRTYKRNELKYLFE